jgi:hypothetical protein
MAKIFIYKVNFTHNGKEYELAYETIDLVRIHLVHGWRLPFDETKVIKSDDNGIIYNQDGITVEQIGFLKENK